MRYSKSFIKTLKEKPKGATSANQALLERGSFVSQVGSGIFAYLPLGYKVYEKIRVIIMEELAKIGAQEVSLPILHPQELWHKSGRLHDIGPELIKVDAARENEFVLAMTCEEVIVDIASKKIQTYQDLPFILNQISRKIRNEPRPRGGLIRLKEFNMQDAYSFHATQDQLQETFDKFAIAYKEIFKRLGLEVVLVEASAGMMGGGASKEFMFLSPAGEDRVLICPKCQEAYNIEVAPKERICPKDKTDLKEEKAIELAHIFQLQDKYSKNFDLYFVDKAGKKQTVLMGCYGIGLDRAMAAIVEGSNDQSGIIWPEKVAPASVYLIDLEGSHAKEVYQKLIEAGIDVLWDDRGVSVGVKFSDADLLGIPNRLVISKKTLIENKVELKKRSQKESRLIDIDKIIDALRR